MLFQPFHLDSFPFVAEAVYVLRNGHLGDFHYLSESSPLGLTFGCLLSITGMSPISLLKIYPGFFIIVCVLFVHLIANKLKPGSTTSIVAPLLFVSILWPSIFHFSRQSFSLIFYFSSLFLLVWLLFEKFDRRIFALLFLQTLLLSISHPATPMFFMFNLVAIAVFGWTFKNVQAKESRLVINVLVISVIIWLLWNMVGTTPGVIHSLREISQSLITALTESPSVISGITQIFAGRTQAYRWIIDIRFLMTGAVYLVSFLIPLITYRYTTHKKALLFLTSWAWSNMLVTVPLLYAGLPYFQKPFLFTISAWAPLTAFALAYKKDLRIEKSMCILAAILIMAGSLLIPLIKYGPLPLEYAPSKELVSKTFLDFHGSLAPIIYFEDPAYHYSYILYNKSDLSARSYSVFGIYEHGQGLNSTILSENSAWVTYRTLTRDAFWQYYPSMWMIVENVTETLPQTTHNKIYDSGWPEYILVPRD